MIQRLQTVFLLLSGMINGVLLFTPLARRAMQDPQMWVGSLFMVFLGSAFILSIYSIFLYRDRIKQMKWVRLTAVAETGALAVGAAVTATLGGFGAFMVQELLSTLLLIVALISLWQAHRLIRKDQELVDSMNRIR